MKYFGKHTAVSMTACAVLLSLAVPAFASDKTEAAADYLRDRQILAGNECGDLMLDKDLSRAEMAVILSRLVGNAEHIEHERAFYGSLCRFSDVPDWARHYVGYCASNHFLMGYDNGLYGSNDPVTPAAACTVMLRYLGCESDDWTYETACDKAAEIGIASYDIIQGGNLDRGDMAVLLYRSILKHTEIDTDATVPNTAYPTEVERYVPNVGDVIQCDDGASYTIRNVDRWDSNMFAEGPLPELPQPTCDWSLLPQPELPAREARHFEIGGQDVLFLRNLYETQRMQFTLYNAISANPQTWRDGRPVTRQDGQPLVDVHLYVPNDLDVQPTWPWRSGLMTEYFNSCPPGDYYMEAWDIFVDGEFRRTEYYYVNI